jgi:hypothetical protein
MAVLVKYSCVWALRGRKDLPQENPRRPSTRACAMNIFLNVFSFFRQVYGGYTYILFEAFMWEAMFELAAKKKEGCF